nr:J domain-containing protein [uncultured Flavobacterium sp.]
MKYFKNIKSLDELKNLFRQLCKELHPDKGGNTKEFIIMFNEYDSLKDSFNNNNENQGKNINSEKFYNILQQLDKLENINISFVGSFIWLTDIIEGSMYKQKDIIKSFIFDGYNLARWASAKKSWYFSPSDYSAPKNKKRQSLDEIKTKYQTKEYKTKGVTKIF